MPPSPHADAPLPWLDAVVPHLDTAAFVAAVRRRIEGRGEAGSLPLHAAYVADLALLYAVRADGSTRFLTVAEVEAAGLVEEELRVRAVENLRRLLPSVERVGGPEAYTLAAGGQDEASLLLDDRLWHPRHLPVEGDLVAAVPRRDVLLVTGTGSPPGVARLRQMAREIHAKGGGALTRELLVRRDHAWEVLPAWAPGGAAPR